MSVPEARPPASIDPRRRLSMPAALSPNFSQARPPRPGPRPAAERAPVETFDTRLETSKQRLERRCTGKRRHRLSPFDQEVDSSPRSRPLRTDDVVLDFGAGRGSWYHDEPAITGARSRISGAAAPMSTAATWTRSCSPIRRWTRPRSRSRAAPCPIEDDRFDLVVSRYVFEHLPDPQWAARELLRVTKPGGWICAMTPNKWGYVAIAARLVPNRLHVAALRFIQPHNKEQDIFPTLYRLNTPGSGPAPCRPWRRRLLLTGPRAFLPTISEAPSCSGFSSCSTGCFRRRSTPECAS